MSLPIQSARFQWGLALLTGVLLTFAFPLKFWSFEVPAGWQGYAAWVAYAPLLLAACGQTLRRVALLTFVSALLCFTGTIFWVVVAMVEYGGVPFWLSLLALVLLAGLLAAFHAVAGVVAAWVVRGRPAAMLLLSFPLALTLLEWVRNGLFTGFPWSNLAYSQSRFVNLIQLADLTGIYGLTLLLSASGAALAWGVCAPSAGMWKRMLPLLGILLLTGGAHQYGTQRLAALDAQPQQTLPVALLQGNIPQSQKWLESNAQNIVGIYTRLSAQAHAQGAALVVWPEASVPNLLPDNLERLPEPIFSPSGPGVPHIVGVPTYDPLRSEAGEVVMHNSAFLVGSDGFIRGRYDKTHLVPFGEYVPLRELLFFLGPVVQAVGTFEPGARLKPLTDGTYQYGVVICYEDIFPEIARGLAREGAQLLLNITNDAWYGPTSALQQHLDMAIFRAIETRLPVARAANTGISAFVDAGGRTLATTRPWEEAVLTMPLPLASLPSFYVKWGDVCVGISALILLCLSLWTHHEQRKQPV
ncbi:MAG: apolipoprotein N-acyltransferase [Myxococcota bacterium]